MVACGALEGEAPHVQWWPNNPAAAYYKCHVPCHVQYVAPILLNQTTAAVRPPRLPDSTP